MATSVSASYITSRHAPERTTRVRLAASFIAVGALLSLTTLTGCSAGGSPESAVTITITPGDSPTPNPADTAPDVIHPSPVITVTVTPSPMPPDPEYTPVVTPIVTPVVTPAPEPTSSGNLIVSLGAVSPSCTHSVCHFVHLAWTSLSKGYHQVQCVSDHAGVGVFSDNSLRFDTTSGAQDLKCFVGYPGSHVWVVVDGVAESNHVNWTW